MEIIDSILELPNVKKEFRNENWLYSAYSSRNPPNQRPKDINEGKIFIEAQSKSGKLNVKYSSYFFSSSEVLTFQELVKERGTGGGVFSVSFLHD